jgi:hypothetical protein
MAASGGPFVLLDAPLRLQCAARFAAVGDAEDSNQSGSEEKHKAGLRDAACAAEDVEGAEGDRAVAGPRGASVVGIEVQAGHALVVEVPAIRTVVGEV